MELVRYIGSSLGCLVSYVLLAFDWDALLQRPQTHPPEPLLQMTLLAQLHPPEGRVPSDFSQVVSPPLFALFFSICDIGDIVTFKCGGVAHFFFFWVFACVSVLNELR